MEAPSPEPSFIEIAAALSRRKLHTLRRRRNKGASSNSGGAQNAVQRAYIQQKRDEQVRQGFSQFGGWVQHLFCLDTVIQTRNRLDEERQSIRKDLEELNPAQRNQYYRTESIRSRHIVETWARERSQLHTHDSVFECFGKCVLQGSSSCSAETKKIMPAAEESSDEIVSRNEPMKPSGGQFVPCAIDVVPNQSGPSGFQVHGIFSPSSSQWLQCLLITCEILPVPLNAPAAGTT